MNGPPPFFTRNLKAICAPNNTELAIIPNADGSINARWLPGPSGGATVTDKSFTTAGAPTSAVVMAANSSRVGYLIENPVNTSLNATGASIFVNLGAVGTVDGDSFEVTPGGYFPPPWLPLYLGTINVIGGATGIKCPAKEMTA